MPSGVECIPSGGGGSAKRGSVAGVVGAPLVGAPFFHERWRRAATRAAPTMWVRCDTSERREVPFREFQLEATDRTVVAQIVARLRRVVTREHDGHRLVVGADRL